MIRTVQINEEGLIEFDETLIQDQEFGKAFLKSLYMEDHVCFGEYKGFVVLVECHTFPLVVHSVEQKNLSLTLNFNYGYSVDFFDIENLLLDDWSRVCGQLETGVPFIFSRSAQFELLEKIFEPLSYNTFKFLDKEYELKEWYVENNEVNQGVYWDKRYQTKDTPWDKGRSHPVIDRVMPRLKLSKSKIFVSGCGTGKDVIRLASLGHVVHGIDTSEQAIEEAQKATSKAVFVREDFFEYASNNEEVFDIVFEHTFFCALSPDRRAKIITSWKKLLKPGGYLLGVFMVALKRQGPPFGATEWEIKELIEKHFKIEYWGRLKEQESLRPGKELFIYAQRKE